MSATVRIAVTGHRSFDAAAAEYIDARVSGLLDRAAERGRPVVVSSLAEGADQLVAQAAVRRGLALEVIVPATGYLESLPEADRRSYTELLEHATSVRTLEHERPSPGAYQEAGVAMLADADLLIAVWDGRPARGTGGSAEIVARARELGLDVEVVWPPGYDRPA